MRISENLWIRTNSRNDVATKGIFQSETTDEEAEVGRGCVFARARSRFQNLALTGKKESPRMCERRRRCNTFRRLRTSILRDARRCVENVRISFKRARARARSEARPVSVKHEGWADLWD